MNKEHSDNPIQWGLIDVCKKKGIPVYNLGEVPKEKNVILYYNKPLSIKGKSVYWWMCDLRKTERLEKMGSYKQRVYG